MDHSEAVDQMATERYLLDELTPELREAFEEHVFDCPECALDLRATAAFVNEIKVQLPELTMESAKESAAVKPNPVVEKRERFSWWKPIFANPMIAGPAFAVLLLVVGYQNLVTYPALRAEVSEPRIVQMIPLRAATRGGALKAIDASHKRDLGFVIDLPQDTVYPSYAVELYDAQGKSVWSKGVMEAASGDGTLSLAIPGSGLQTGAYDLRVSGVSAAGERAEVVRYELQIQFSE